jgi:type IV fimbrial biogenesis protein FimT
MHPQSGFTLFELIMVITIVAILAAIGIPSFKYVTSSNRISAEVNQLLGDMRYARTEAIKEGQTVTVCASANPTATTPTCSLSNSWETGWIVFSDPNNNKALPAGTVPLRRQNSLSIAYFSTDTITADNAFSAETFNREGFGAANIATPATTVTMTLHTAPANPQWTRCLQITPIGMLTVEKASVNSCS